MQEQVQKVGIGMQAQQYQQEARTAVQELEQERRFGEVAGDELPDEGENGHRFLCFDCMFVHLRLFMLSLGTNFS